MNHLFNYPVSSSEYQVTLRKSATIRPPVRNADFHGIHMHSVAGVHRCARARRPHVASLCVGGGMNRGLKPVFDAIRCLCDEARIIEIIIGVPFPGRGAR